MVLILKLKMVKSKERSALVLGLVAVRPHILKKKTVAHSTSIDCSPHRLVQTVTAAQIEPN